MSSRRKIIKIKKIMKNTTFKREKFEFAKLQEQNNAMFAAFFPPLRGFVGFAACQ